MVAKSIIIFAAVGISSFCLSQSTLTTPAPGNTQCIGSDCPRQGTASSTQQSNPPGSPIPAPYPLGGPGGPAAGAEHGRANEGAATSGTSGPEAGVPRPAPGYGRTEFERFVQASVGRDLRLFGREFFAEVPSTFAPVDRIPVRGDYIIGPGDELLIQAWGKIDLDARVVVDRNGQIYIPRVGAINVAGIRYEQLNPFLHAAVARFFKDFDLNVSVGQLRSVQVFVLGYARRPGTYTVSSLSTLVNALFAAGGPAPDGSMRHVQLKRNNALVTDLDVYDLILKGDKSGDAALQSGDVIYIPPAGSLVAVAGSVKRPAIYELREATTLGEAVASAGGLTSVATAKRISLERIDTRSERVFDEFALDPAGLGRQLQDGDVVRIFPVSPRIANAVTLRGNVAQPGRYLWHEGLRISDVIPSRDTLITRQYWNTQNAIVPLGRDDNEFAPRKRELPAGQNDDTGNGQGAGTTSPNSNPDAANVPRASSDAEPGQRELRTEVKHGGSEINWEYAVIERLNQSDLTTELIPFNLGKAIDQRASGDNHRLEPGDVVTVFSQEDVPVAKENRSTFVQVSGEVKAPGVYRVAPGETLRDAVNRAGGLAAHAYLYGAELLRESAKQEQRRRLAQMVERMQRELSETSAASASLSADERSDEQARIQEQRAFIERLARVQPQGRVVLQLKPTDAQLSDIPAMPLEDGDVFTIPAKGDTIQVLGSVYNENTFRFRPGQRVATYLSNAGGPTRGADKAHMFIIRADGSVYSKQQESGILHGNNFNGMRLMPGDAIVVPQRFKTRNSLAAFRDWTQIFAQLAIGAAAINVIK